MSFFDPFVDHRASQNKKFWAARHRWAAPPPETWASLCGEVDAASVSAIIAAVEQTPDAAVVLSIESNGGNPIEALRLYNSLRGHPGPITCMTSRCCHSAAVIVFLAGDIRVASRNAEFLLHRVERPSSSERPTATTLRAEASDLDQLDDQIIQLIGSRSQFYGWRLRADMDNETVLDAATAQLRGIVHEVID
jgi:ATP-dependent Clp protease protease subunit